MKMAIAWALGRIPKKESNEPDRMSSQEADIEAHREWLKKKVAVYFDHMWSCNTDELDMPINGYLYIPEPPSTESRDFEIIRRSLDIGDDVACVSGSDWEKLREPDKARIRNLSHNFIKNHNPFIRHIVRRTRDFLENERNERTLSQTY